MSEPRKTCFVIMPFTDPSDYEHGHFRRVYEHLIRPACEALGLNVLRGDDVKSTNYIAIDVLQRVLKSDIVVCDLSSRNANVLYELGIRQAFDLPVVLVKDERTERIFDIQGLRTVDYRSTLRVDTVDEDRTALRQAIDATLKLEDHEINSLVRLLGIEKAQINHATPVSAETALLLSSLKELSTRLLLIERGTVGRYAKSAGDRSATLKPIASSDPFLKLPSGTTAEVGDLLYATDQGKRFELGRLVAVGPEGVTVRLHENELVVYPPDDPLFATITDLPF